MLEEIKKAQVLILGFGVEGQATLRFLQKKFPEKEFTVADRKNITAPQQIENAKHFKVPLIRGKQGACFFIFGQNYLKNLDKFELIIKSPGIKPDLPELVEFKKQGGKITSATNLFMSEVQGTVIGVTGSKGKSTVSSLLYAVLKEAEKNVKLIGNIGNPALDILVNDTKDRFYVYEMSSYQIEDLEQKPQFVLMNNLFPEHLDYHGNLENYYKAKLNIIVENNQADISQETKNQTLRFKSETLNQLSVEKKSPLRGLGGVGSVEVTDSGQARKTNKIQTLFYNAGSKELVKRMQNLNCQKTSFNNGKNSKISKGKLIDKNEEIIAVKDVKLLGKHNLENILGVIAVSRELGVGSWKIQNAIKKFKNLEHRLEFVGKFQEIDFYNDSISTTPESTIQAIQTFGDELDTLILGGLDRGYDFTELVNEILKSNIRNLILFPDTGEKILIEIKNLELKIKNSSKTPLRGQGGVVDAEGKNDQKDIAQESNKTNFKVQVRDIEPTQLKIKNFQAEKLPNTNYQLHSVKTMGECVKIAFQATKKGKVCLLSPAAPSYNLFKNFVERGNLYKKFIQESE